MESFGLRKSAPRKPEAPVHPPAANDEDHMEFVHLHVIAKIYRALRAQTDFKISWRRWTGINSIFCWLVKRGEVNMKKLFSLRMATGFS